MIFLTVYYGNYAIAATLFILLLQRLDAQGILGKARDGTMSPVRTKIISTLQELHGMSINPQDTASAFAREIKSAGLLPSLETLSSKLAVWLCQLETEVENLRKQGYNENEAIEILGKEGYQAAKEHNTLDNDIFDARVHKDKKVKNLIEKINSEIQRILKDQL